MRCVAGVGLLALVACNQIFSLAPTREFDASISIDVVPDLPHVVLDYQVASVLPSGGPDPTITFAPLVPAPLVQIATLGSSFVGTDYSPTDGWVLIPRSYLGTTWRLEYTLVDGVTASIPHEVQWAPEDKLGHLTVPLFGRAALDALPFMAGYKIKPTGAPTYQNPVVLTTGLWTNGDARIDPVDPATVSTVLSDANWLSGKKGRLAPLLGDRAFLVDYTVSTAGDDRDCRFAVGSVMLDSAAVQPGPPIVQTPKAAWDAAVKNVMSKPLDVAFVVRLQAKLGKLHTAVTGNVLLGSSPSTSMPGLASVSPSLPLPLPVMATMLQCPYSPNPLDAHRGIPVPDAAQPPGLEGFPRILHIQLVDTRTVLGVTLTSGMEVVLPSGPMGFTIEFPAAIPTGMTLATPSKGVLDLTGDSEQLDAGAASGAFRLDFTSEIDGTKLRADYHDILLHRFEGASLTTERIYTVTAPSVQIDGAVLRPSTVYVLEIRTYKGHPSAARGDFAPIDYPYGAAIVFTRTFKTS